MTREELAALELLRSTGAPLLEAAQVACAAMRAAGGKMARAMQCIALSKEEIRRQKHTVPLAEAVWSSIEARGNLRPTSRRDLRNYARRILRVEGAGELPLRAMKAADCRRILASAFGGSKSSYVKGRAILSSVFSHGIRQEWCDSNPVRHIAVPKVTEKAICPLTPHEVERLHAAAERPEHRAMRFSLRLMLYGGIRPTEVSRLRAEDIRWEQGEVIIRPATSKTGGGRAVPLRGMRGLCKADRHIPRNWQRRWQALRRAAGFRRGAWVPDVCRHTFASYHAAYFRNLAQLQLEMGHRDLSLLRTRYICPLSCARKQNIFQGAGATNTASGA